MSDDKKTQMMDLLKTQHTFPGPYTFKFIGRADETFAARVVAAVQGVLGSSDILEHVARHSGKGGHVSVTIVPTVASAEQVLAVYDAVAPLEGVLVSM